MRFAIYYAPENHSMLHVLGSRWLGRDAFSGTTLEQPGHGYLKGKTEPPARYGFHATLKAPFQLADRTDEAQVLLEARKLAQSVVPAHIQHLVVSEIDGFVALVPEHRSTEVDGLANECVRAFDHLRKPTEVAELARRHEAGLSQRQAGYLGDWGYPFVFEEFRFHMTLSGKLRGEELAATKALAEQHFAAVNRAPLTLRNISVFVEPHPGGPFNILEQVLIGTEKMAVSA